MAKTTSQGWHIANYGALGWLETALKSVGILLGFAAFAGTSSDMPLVFGASPRLPAIILVEVMLLFCLAAIAARLKLKDIVAMVFAVANLLGHLALLVALLRTPSQTTLPQTMLPLLFGLAYLAGDGVKMVWLQESGYTEGGFNTAGMRRLVIIVMTLYALYVVALII